MLKEMLGSQGFTQPINMRELPKVGFISFIGKHAIAAGFLRKVEGGYALLDGLTSNAQFGSQFRHIGISKVVNELILTAKQLKLKGIIATTSDESIIKRAKTEGFQVLNEVVMSMPLTK